MEDITEKTLQKVIEDHAEILPGEPQTVRAQGEEFIIRPFKFINYAKAIKSVSKILDILNLQERLTELAKITQNENGESEVSLNELLGSLFDFEIIQRICDEATEEIVNLMAIATGKPREWFDDLEADEGLELAGAVIGVNISFFIQRVVAAGANAINRVTRGLGIKPLATSPTNAPATE